MQIDKAGHVIDQRVRQEIRPLLERGAMPVVAGIIVHQTDASTAKSSLDAYKTRPIGAHFLIDKAAAVTQRVNHVGKLRSRCVAEHSCEPKEAAEIARMTPSARNRHEMEKSVPARYPSNVDSIGIELVGKSTPAARPRQPAIYEAVTAAQNESLAWLIAGLTGALNIKATEIFDIQLRRRRRPRKRRRHGGRDPGTGTRTSYHLGDGVGCSKCAADRYQAVGPAEQRVDRA